MPLSERTVSADDNVSTQTPPEDHFEENHREYFSFVSVGDVLGLSDFIRQHPDHPVNTPNEFGDTALHVAVEKDHENVVGLLMDVCSVAVIIGELMFAISSNHASTAELMIEHNRFEDVSKELKERGKFEVQGRKMYQLKTIFTAEDVPDSGASLFSPDMSPILLGAQRNLFGVVGKLLAKGHFIDNPHKFSCCCRRCATMDDLRRAKSRLDTYTGLCSSAYLLLSSTDPVLTALDLRRVVRSQMDIESYFKQEYADLATQLDSFANYLLTAVRDEHELMTLLDKGHHLDEFGDLERLKLAVNEEWKQFIRHPAVQSKLISRFYEGGEFFRELNIFRKAETTLAILLLYPLMAVVFLVAPNSSVGRFVSRPWVRLVTSMMFFVTFLCIILFTSNVISSTININQFPALKENVQRCMLNDTRCAINFPMLESYEWNVRGVALTWDRYLIAVFVLAMIFQSCCELYEAGFRDYVRWAYNWLDFVGNMFYLIYYGLTVATSLRITSAVTYLSNASHWELFVSGTDEQIRCGLQEFYWILADRWYFEYYDPICIRDSFYALANLLSFVKLSYYFSLDELLGPMRVSLTNMLKSIALFGGVFMCVFIAYFVSITNLYWYYSGLDIQTSALVEHDTSSVEAVQALSSNWGTILQMIHCFFGWGISNVYSLLGFGNQYYQYLDLPTTVTDNNGTFSVDVLDDDTLPKAGNIVQTFGLILWIMYLLTMIIIMLNMLIAMMNEAYEETNKEAATEWKFVRTQLMLDLLEPGSTLSCPFNLLPNLPLLFRQLLYKPIKHKINERKLRIYTITVPVKNACGIALHVHHLEVKLCETCSYLTEARLRNGSMQQSEMVNCPHGHPDADLRDYRDYEKVLHTIVKRIMFEIDSNVKSNQKAQMNELKEDVANFQRSLMQCVQNLQDDHRSQNGHLDKIKQLTLKTIEQQQRQNAAVEELLNELQSIARLETKVTGVRQQLNELRLLSARRARSARP